MKKKNVSLRSAYDLLLFFMITVVPSLLFSVPAAVGDDDLRSLELFNGTETEIVSGNRSPRPASQTAENITVVTASEIEALNAHTLPDILYAVTGVQLESNRTPGTSTNIEIQGSNFNHILVLIDNVPINNLADNFADVGSVPVQMIERIEIVKGAASSSWGSALGGVINIITKSPDAERALGGVVSGSLGQRQTADGRAEASGTLNRFGYYLTGGKLRSDGLRANNSSDLNSFYAKLQYQLPVSGTLTFSTALTEGSSGQFATEIPYLDQQNNLQVATLQVGQESDQLVSTLALQYPLANRFTLDASLRTRQSDSEVFARDTTRGFLVQRGKSDDASEGGSIKLSWIGEAQRVVAGIDYDHVSTRLEASLQRLPEASPMWSFNKRRADRIGIYLIDTLTVGSFAITPSARFDSTGSGGDHFSPSFGITYALTENSVLRGYTARGYSLTSLIRPDATEKVWTSQLGFESGDLPYLWVKGTLFRNDTRDVLRNLAGNIRQRQLKQGVELEARTLPLFNTSVSTGYTFISATDGDNGGGLKGIPKHTLKIGLRYQDPSDLHAVLTGNYTHWNDLDAKYGAIIWDLHLRKMVEFSEFGSLELFVSVRNLLNDEQYLNNLYKNAGRWGEAGVRCNF